MCSAPASGPPSGPAPVPPSTGHLVRKELRVAEPVTTVVLFNGKLYTVTFTPPASKEGTAQHFHDNTIEKIETLAKGILQKHHEASTSNTSLANTHTIKAIFTKEEGSSTNRLQLQTKEKGAEFKDLTIDDLTSLAQEVDGIFTSVVITKTPSALPISHTSTRAFETKEILGKHYYVDELKAAIQTKAILPVCVHDVFAVITTYATIERDADGNVTGVEIKTPDALNALIAALIAAAPAADAEAPAADAEAAAPASPLYQFLLDVLKEVPSGAIIPASGVAVPDTIFKGIANPQANCFMNASITGFLSNAHVYGNLMTALTSLKSNDTNPTVLPAASAAPSPIPADFKEWEINTPKTRAETFKAMTIGQAATCAKSLLQKWHDRKEPLDARESQLLRMSLIKLFNIQHQDGAPEPHVTTVNDSILSLDPAISCDSEVFRRNLLKGLKELTGNAAIDFTNLDNPSGVYEKTILSDGRISNPHDLNWSIQEINTDNKEVLSTEVKRKPIKFKTLAIEILPPLTLPAAEGRDKTTVDCSAILTSLKPVYDIESLTVYKTKSDGADGHYWSYRKINNIWYRYDDYMNPLVFKVTDDEINQVVTGKMKNSQVRLMTFKKRHKGIPFKRRGLKV